MSLQDIKDVLTFAAFLPEPDDPSASWKKRFSNRRSLLVDIGKSSHHWAILGKGGKIQSTGKAEGEMKEAFAGMREEWKKGTDGGWACLSLNTRYVISLEVNLSRKKGSELILKSNPRAVLGSKYEKGKRYAITHNPESNTSLLLTCDEDHIKKVETVAKDAGLQIGRVCVGTYAMLRHLLIEVNKHIPKGAAPKPEDGQLFVVCNHGSVCILGQAGQQWVELRSRTDVYADDPSPVLDLLSPFKQQFDGPLSVAFLCNDMHPPLAMAIENFFPGAKFADFTKPGQLWGLLRDN